jgi:TRAP-type C4-dicarboxylate transport system substrate-binding protein
MMRNWIAVVVLLPCLAVAGPKQTIKIATLAPAGTTWVNELEKTNLELQKASGGELAFQIYSGGVLGDESDVVRKMRVGQVQAAAFTGMGLGEILPEVRVLELPFLAQKDGQVDRLSEQLFPHFERAYRAKNMVLLGFVPVGFVYMFSDLPIRSIEEMKRTKMWVWEGDPLARGLFAEAGVSGIPLALPDVLTSLQTKLIHAVYGTPLAVIALQWHTKVKYRTDLAITHAMGGILLSQKTFDRLPEHLRRLLTSESAKLCKRLAEAGRKENVEALKTLEKAGIGVAVVPPKEREAFFALAPKVAEGQTGKLFSAELLKQARAIAAK